MRGTRTPILTVCGGECNAGVTDAEKHEKNVSVVTASATPRITLEGIGRGIIYNPATLAGRAAPPQRTFHGVGVG
jgi:hypothetical protein